MCPVSSLFSASPVQFAGPRRNFPVPHALESLPPVDFVLISHNHYDHLDLNTIRKLGPRPTYYVPLGLKQWFNERGACFVPAPWVGKVCVLGEGERQISIFALIGAAILLMSHTALKGMC